MKQGNKIFQEDFFFSVVSGEKGMDFPESNRKKIEIVMI